MEINWLIIQTIISHIHKHADFSSEVTQLSRQCIKLARNVIGKDHKIVKKFRGMLVETTEKGNYRSLSKNMLDVMDSKTKTKYRSVTKSQLRKTTAPINIK